jgi:dihydropteroate synthase
MSLRYQFVTGKLAEFSLRQVLEGLAPKVGFSYEVAVLPITVAALMPPKWIAKHLIPAEGIDKVIIPGYCQGDLDPIREKAGAEVVLGPRDLRDLPAWFGLKSDRQNYGAYRIEILAEINHAPRLSRADLVAQARALAGDGADLIDLGCTPGETWGGVGDAVAALRDLGLRVSIDSFEPDEVAAAVARGADLVLSVNSSNREHAPDWGVEVVVVPDRPGTLDGLEATVNFLERHEVAYRIDPILEPIGFGFAASLGRFLAVREWLPEAPMMMGVGNLTELTDVDSAGMNVTLLGFCEEVGVGSILTTQVINWARSCVKELDLGRRLVHHAVENKVLPKRLEPGLVMLRDPKVPSFGPENLAELARRITDPNYRIFAEGGLIHVMNNAGHLTGTDPFELFDRMQVKDAGHAFYIGYELMKAKTALTLGKAYRQDQALDWGFLTEPEISRHERLRRAKGRQEEAQDREAEAAVEEDSLAPGPVSS